MYHFALKIATEAHKGQKDKAGIDYIEHPKTVASLVKTEEEKIVALLHDVIEDTHLTVDDLRRYGFSNDIVSAIQILTKTKGMDYMEYLRKVKENPLARAVKIADLTHNSDLNRLKIVTEKDIERQNKYQKALHYLNS